MAENRNDCFTLRNGSSCLERRNASISWFMSLFRGGIDRAGEGGYGEMRASRADNEEGRHATLQLNRLFESKMMYRDDKERRKYAYVEKIESLRVILSL